MASSAIRCAQCGKTYTEPHEKPLEGMTIPQEKALLALRLLVEGNSIRSIERTTELHRDTILRLLVLVGEKCEKLMGRLIVNVPVKDVQCDEIWGYVQKKEAHKLPEEANDKSIGDAYCFVAIERNTKLVLNFALGRRRPGHHGRLHRRACGPRLRRNASRSRTDGFQPYISRDHDHASATAATSPNSSRSTARPRKRSTPVQPSRCYACGAGPSHGGSRPGEDLHVSHVERQNLTIRMQMRRLTRLTNAFSQEVGEPVGRVLPALRLVQLLPDSQTLRVTPAMEAGITDRVWTLADLLAEAVTQRISAVG